jgi:hypothetical protein
MRPRAGGTTYAPTRRGSRVPSAGPLRAALYARVSTSDQTPENQLVALRAFTTARGWEPTEFVDHGVSGAKDRRPALDALLAAVRARQVDRVVCVRLDRLARSTRHLVALAADFEASAWIWSCSTRRLTRPPPAAASCSTCSPPSPSSSGISSVIASWPGCGGPRPRAAGSADRVATMSMSSRLGRWSPRACHSGRSPVVCTRIRWRSGGRSARREPVTKPRRQAARNSAPIATRAGRWVCT